MQVKSSTYLGKPSLSLIPETFQEIYLLKQSLGSKNPLSVLGLLREPTWAVGLTAEVILWENRELSERECVREQDGLGPEVRITRKRADLNAFMNVLCRYVDNLIDYRLHEKEDHGSLGQYTSRVEEAAQGLREVLKPLFEEEVH